jgi:alpha-L-fucosidase
MTPASLVPCLTACLALLTAGVQAENTPAQSARIKWWTDARFGLFIHWGPVSLRGTEIGWSRGEPVPAREYDELYRRFNPTNFNAREWARTAKEAGMKYLVLTSKHHDGFCLWDTAYTDYNIMHTPFGRDVIKELSAACRHEGIRFCLYHSILDWYHPDYPLDSPGGRGKKPNANMDQYNLYLKNQLAELHRKYGPIGIYWFDGEWEAPWNNERARDLFQHVRQLDPKALINNRVGKGREDMAGTTKTGALAADFDTPEQRVGKFQNDRPWESCITMCEQWAWKPNDKMKSTTQCLRTLIQCAGGDGNLLFNVGPMPDGRIEPRQVERLREMGAWLKQYGVTIYGTRGGPFKPGTWGASTFNGRTLYIHLFDLKGGRLELPPIKGRIVSHKLLTGGTATVAQSPTGISITVPPSNRQVTDTILALKLDVPVNSLAPVEVK